jgi:hypothetical protein
MKQKLIAVASAAMIGLTAVAIPSKVEAHWRGGGGGWWVPGAVIGGLALGTAIASRPYYYGPGYYGYAYDPYYYDYGPSYYGGGPYYYARPYRYYRRPYRHWTEF